MAKQALVFESAVELWIYVVTSFTRYSKVGREARRAFQDALQRDGFFRMHENLFVRYCTTSDNAARHKEKIKGCIPARCCDISIILSSDNTGGRAFHSLNRKRTNKVAYGKPAEIEIF